MNSLVLSQNSKNREKDKEKRRKEQILPFSLPLLPFIEC
jgi:hypothetical protein